ncbi:hypothetical protein [Mycobacterium parmense]|uniref:hypothetical protein n=1 Tax=Mycobacterium parmense TaxID=185642 RepID=UPI00111C169F|nr:hypothetical protein [Mycobacterium parmense]MCV7352179.1 hypothetical protein [Mycobacterium parmense]
MPLGFTHPGGTTPVEHGLRTQQAVAQMYSDWRGAHSPNIAPEILKDNAGAFQVSDAPLASQPALDAAKADADAAQSRVDDLVKGQKVDNDIEARLAAQSFWHRKERVLDSVTDKAKLIAAVEELIRSAPDDQIANLAEELPDYLASRGLPSDWLSHALVSRVPGLDDAQAEATLKAKQHAVLAQNHAALTKAITNDNPPPPLLDPYSPAITAKPYTNGESFDPSSQ